MNYHVIISGQWIEDDGWCKHIPGAGWEDLQIAASLGRPSKGKRSPARSYDPIGQEESRF